MATVAVYSSCVSTSNNFSEKYYLIEYDFCQLPQLLIAKFVLVGNLHEIHKNFHVFIDKNRGILFPDNLRATIIVPILHILCQ